LQVTDAGLILRRTSSGVYKLKNKLFDFCQTQLHYFI